MHMIEGMVDQVARAETLDGAPTVDSVSLPEPDSGRYARAFTAGRRAESSLALSLTAKISARNDLGRWNAANVLATIEEASAATDPVTHTKAMHRFDHYLLGPEYSMVRRRLALDMVGDSFHTGQSGDMLAGMLLLTVNLFLDGDPHAERRLTEVRELLAHGAQHAVGSIVEAIDVMLAIRAGEMTQAERLTVAYAERADADADADAQGWHLAQMIAIRWYQGRIADLLPSLSSRVDAPSVGATSELQVAALALAAAVAGDRRTAILALSEVRGHDLADLPRSSSWLATMNAVVEAAHLLGDHETSAQAYKLLQPFAALPIMSGPGVVCFGSVHHTLGVASLTCDRLDEAVDHLRSAVQHNLALAHWPAVEVSRRRYAQALARRDHPWDAATARRELASSAAESATLKIETPRDTSGSTLACSREGGLWRVTVGQCTAYVQNSVGMLHLAVLTANPHQEIPATDLVAGLDALSNATEAGKTAYPWAADATAARDHRHRLTQLRLQIDKLESHNDLEGAARVQTERDVLLGELASNAGMRGRRHRNASGSEQARIAVGKAVRRAIQRIAEADATIGEHLRGAIHTGIRCSYRPD